MSQLDSGMMSVGRTTSPLGGVVGKLQHLEIQPIKQPKMHCGDCNSDDCQWASINRGVYLCDQCAIIHREMGRHYSQVKHLKHSQWEESQKEMLSKLVTSGANKIWEHSLHDPVIKSNPKKYVQKPIYTDSLDDKRSYIRAKYEQLLYMCKDEDSSEDSNELNSQLFAAARTNELLTSLRLLAQGARPDWQNPEKNNDCSLHIAASFNQHLQVELLSIYGANPSAINDDGKLPEDVAREKGHDHLYIRLLEIKFEVSDRLSFYRFQKKPTHSRGYHFIPSNLLNIEKSTVDGKERLSRLSETAFQELCADVYDEVDRRELETVWRASNGSRRSTTTSHIAHLALHPNFTQMRNQGRQKIARFSQQEFFNLLNDVIFEIIKRAGFADGTESPDSTHDLGFESDDQENIYDDVATPSSGDNDRDPDIEVANINSTNDEDKQKIEQLQTQLDEQLETIRLLKEENDQFKKKITEQAREIENYRRSSRRPNSGSNQFRPLSEMIPRRVISPSLPSSTSTQPAEYEHICKGVIRSLKSLVRSLQTKNENGNVDIPTLENHSQEMSRCLSDLIKLFQSNPALARKLEESRDQLQSNCASLPPNPSEDDLQPLYSNAYETAALIREVLEPSES